jgi:hypothetical protein
MSGRRMDWRRARLHGRPSLDFRREGEFEDRADRWLKAVERRPRERSYATSNSTVSRSTNWSTVANSTGVPW